MNKTQRHNEKNSKSKGRLQKNTSKPITCKSRFQTQITLYILMDRDVQKSVRSSPKSTFFLNQTEFLIVGGRQKGIDDSVNDHHISC